MVEEGGKIILFLENKIPMVQPAIETFDVSQISLSALTQ